MPIKTLQHFAAASGLRTPWSVPSQQWCGPQFFEIDFTIVNGTAPNIDMLERGRMFGCLELRQGYGIPSTSPTDRLKAFMQVEAYCVKFVDNVTDIDLDTLQKLFATATAPYVEGKCNGQDFKWSLARHITQPLEQFQIGQATAAALDVGILKGSPRVLPSPMIFDMYQDTITLKADADVALGVNVAMKLCLYGIVVPDKTEGAESFSYQNGGCGVDIEQDGNGRMTERGQQRLSRIRIQNQAVVQSDLKI